MGGPVKMQLFVACLVLGLGAISGRAQQTTTTTVAGKDNPRVLKTHPVSGSNAQALAKSLQDIFGKDFKATALGNNQLVVLATAEEHAQIEPWIRPATRVEVIPLPSS